MEVAKNLINDGFIQGIVSAPPTFPNDTTAMFTIKIKDRVFVENSKKKTEGDSSNEEATSKKLSVETHTHFISCVAFEDLAVQMKNVEMGQLIYVRYHLSNSKRINHNGIAEFFENRVIDQIVAGEMLGGDRKLIPYLNEGICQGEFVSITPTLSDPDNAVLMIKTMAKGAHAKNLTHYIQFLIQGNSINNITKYYEPGYSICVKYKIKTINKNGVPQSRYEVTSVV